MQDNLVNLSETFLEHSFNASNIKVSNVGYYLLDSADRQIMYISNNDEIYTAGGYGTSNDAFIDPIDIITSKLKVYVVDGAENNVVIYDHKLNYLKSVAFDKVYPIYCDIDDWGNIYLYSEIENKVFKLSEGNDTLSEFIDLSIYKINENTVLGIYIAKNGKMAILCKESLFIYNRLGRLELETFVKNKLNFIFFESNQWYGIDEKSNVINVKYGKMVTSLDSMDIIDAEYFNDSLYILLKNQIWIVDVELE